MQIPKNPFSLTYRKIYEMGKNSPALSKHIAPMNFIELTEDESALKQSISQADLPELVLVMTAIEDNREDYTSSTVSFITEYTWILTTGSKNGYLATTLNWTLLTLMQSWCAELTKLRWNEKPFIKLVTFSQATVQLENAEQNRGIEGWTMVWPLLVTKVINKKDLATCQDLIPANMAF